MTKYPTATGHRSTIVCSSSGHDVQHNTTGCTSSSHRAYDLDNQANATVRHSRYYPVEQARSPIAEPADAPAEILFLYFPVAAWPVRMDHWTIRSSAWRISLPSLPLEVFLHFSGRLRGNGNGCPSFNGLRQEASQTPRHPFHRNMRSHVNLHATLCTLSRAIVKERRLYCRFNADDPGMVVHTVGLLNPGGSLWYSRLQRWTKRRYSLRLATNLVCASCHVASAGRYFARTNSACV